MDEVQSQLSPDSWVHGLMGCSNDINNTGKQLGKVIYLVQIIVFQFLKVV